MTLTISQSINGIFSLIFVIISVGVGIRITLGYLKEKERLYLLVGIAWILLSEEWYPSAISYLIALLSGTDGLKEIPQLYFIIGNVGLPIASILWITFFTDIFYNDKQKVIVYSYIIIGFVFEIIFFSLISIDPDLIGILSSAVDVQYGPLVTIYAIFIIIQLVISGAIFARVSIRSDNPEQKLKGKLLLVAYILVAMGGFLDSSNFVPEWFLPITRIILILSSLCFMGGFILPNWMKKILLKERKLN